MLRILFVCLASFILGSNGKAPSITPCKWDDEKCLIASAQPVVPILAAGIPDLGIAPVDPVDLKDISAEEGGLKIAFKNFNVIGLANCKIHSVRRDISKSTFHVVLDCPIKATGQYKIEGNLIGVPVDGEGPCEIKSNKLRITASLITKEVDGKDSKKYWKISKVDYTYEPLEKFHFNLENLYGGDKERATTILNIINENSDDLIKTLGKPIIAEVVNHCVKSIKQLLLAIPIDELQLA